MNFQSFGTSQEYYVNAYAKKDAVFVEVNWYIFFDSNITLGKRENLVQNMN